MVNRVQTIRYYTTLQRPPTTEFSGELYINFADIQIGALNKSKSPVDFVAVRYYSQTATYVAGDFAIYNGNLYRCLVNNTTGVFDASKWSYFAGIQEIQILIAVETQRAEAAEQNLQTEINTETTARIAGDQNLQNEIDAINHAITQIFPPGVSMDYYGVNAPSGWLLEDGAVYNISTYPVLGALLGSMFGGNGTTTFAVPNSLTRFGIASGAGFPLGATGGSTTATLNLTNLPSHTHTIQPHIHTGTIGNHTHAIDWGLVASAGSGIEGGVGPTGFLPSSTTFTESSTGTINVNASAVLTTDATGGSGGAATPINFLPSYISRTRIIKT